MKYENSNRSISVGDLVRIRNYITSGAYETEDGLYVVTGIIKDSDQVVVSKDRNGRVTGEDRICTVAQLWLDQAFVGRYKNNPRDIRYGDTVMSTKAPFTGKVVGFVRSPFSFIKNKVIISNEVGQTTQSIDTIKFMSRD